MADYFVIVKEREDEIIMKLVLCCGSGASSGFMAQAIKKAAKKRGIDAEVTARSANQIENFLNGTDAVLIAPHLQAEASAIAKTCGSVPTVVIDRTAYGTLDGNKALDQALAVMKK